MGRSGSFGSGAGTAGLGALAACVVAVVLRAALAAGSAEASDVAPQLDLVCEVDVCTLEATYALPTRRDGHLVELRWESRPEVGYRDNDGDVVDRRLLAGTGVPREHDGRYLYRITDIIWHSDIRCDDVIRVHLSADGYRSGSTSARKAVPDDAEHAYCSDYGMPDESS